MRFSYPLKLSFRLIALAPRISITDANGREIFYIEQKVFALREAVKVFNSSKEKIPLFMIKANQMLDFGARYYILTADGEKRLGSVQQEGMRSLFRASYAVLDSNDNEIFRISQQRPWAALLDSILSMIPFVEFITGYILNPTYAVKGKKGHHPILLMKKNPSFFESQFTISMTADEINSHEELLVILSLVMIIQLERGRS